MKKILVSSYESGEIFVVCPQNTSRGKIFEAVRSYTQEKTERPVITLSNYSYETESKWQKRKLASEERGEGFLWDDIPVIRL